MLTPHFDPPKGYPGCRGTGVRAKMRALSSTKGATMKANVGSADRAIRLVLGLVLLSGYFWLGGAARWVALIGLALVVTAGLSFCPLYTLLGISTGGHAAKGR